MKHPSDGGADVTGWIRPRGCSQSWHSELPTANLWQQPSATGLSCCSVDRTAMPLCLLRAMGWWDTGVLVAWSGGKVAPL